uniref:PDZ domain-containing protein n=1 Tax=Pyrodinium bahamense TaxID=73915 RepID=A0A7S0AA22_9DINO
MAQAFAALVSKACRRQAGLDMAAYCCTQLVLPSKLEEPAFPEIPRATSEVFARCCCSKTSMPPSPKVQRFEPVLPQEWDVFVARSPGRCEIGLDVTPEDQVRLKVLRVKDGLVKDWNNSQPIAALRVAEGQRIVAVNGISGSSGRLLQTLMKDSELRLTLMRPV